MTSSWRRRETDMKKTRALLFVFSLLIAMTVLVSVGYAATEEFPAKNRVINFIVGYDPGGFSDVLCQLVSAPLKEYLGVPVALEYLPGAANMVALNALYTRPADGYTISMATVSDSPWAYAASPTKNPRWKGDDFRILARVTAGYADMGIIAKKGRWKSFPEYVKEIRSKPEKTYNHGIIGPGRHDDLQIAELEKALGIKFNIVHYGGSNAIQTDILTGDLDSGTIGCNRSNFLSNENFDVLALYGDSLPDYAPVKGLPLLGQFEEELGYKWADFKYLPLPNGNMCLIINAKTDPKIVDIYKEALRKVMKNEEYRASIFKLGSYPDILEEQDALAMMESVADAIRQAEEDAKNSIK
jgi:tripartite-type tricarboxylate transporter receptor subunit TctC